METLRRLDTLRKLQTFLVRFSVHPFLVCFFVTHFLVHFTAPPFFLFIFQSLPDAVHCSVPPDDACFPIAPSPRISLSPRSVSKVINVASE